MNLTAKYLLFPEISLSAIPSSRQTFGSIPHPQIFYLIPHPARKWLSPDQAYNNIEYDTQTDIVVLST